MKLKIGENIKCLRRGKDITQEKLAEMLGVSCQSVSRWELGTCYPDLELLPAIAGIFRVSVDSLLGVDDLGEREKVEEYLQRFRRAINKGKIEECISVAREGVGEFPNNFVLLNKLMYALFVSGDDTGNLPEWQENMTKYDAEIVALGERIIRDCPDQEIRLDATARLAFQHMEMGRKSMGRALFETLPPREFCRENWIWWGLEDDEKLQFLREELRILYEGLKGIIWSLGSCGHLPAKESVIAYQKAFELDRLICDGNLPRNSWGNARMHYELARIHAELGKKQEMYEYLDTALAAAKAFDGRPESQSYESVLLGTVTESALDFETSDSRPVEEIFRKSWLLHSAFDPYREEERFAELISG